MKARHLLILIIMIGIINTSVFAQDNSLLNKLKVKIKEDIYGIKQLEQFDNSLYDVLASINTPTPPFVFGEYFVFLYFNSSHTDRVKIAFEHELYSQIHSFIKITNNPDIEVFVLPRIYKDQRINYRLIINGLWTIDHNNPDFRVDSRGIQISTVFIPKIDPLFLPAVMKIDEKTVRFYLYLDRGKTPIQDTQLRQVAFEQIPRKQFFLTGSFSNWDPFLIEMKPTDNTNSLFFVDLPLKEGIHYYYYQAGSINFLDPNNRSLARRSVSGEYVNAFQVYSSIKDTTGAKTFVVSTMDISRD